MRSLSRLLLGAGVFFAVLIAGTASTAGTAIAEDFDKSYYVTAGAGYLFLEKDEELLGQQLYEVRVGMHTSPRWTFEAGFGGMPDARNRNFRRPELLVLEDDTWGYRFVVDALYHFYDDAWGSSFDPYLGMGGGIAVYDEELEDGHNDLFVGVGPGAFFGLNDDWFAKADYRVAMVGHDTEVNHHVLLSLGYTWGGPDKRTAVAGSFDEDTLERVYFPFDSAQLTAEARATLQRNADWLKANPEQSVTLEGHCDERGTNEYNFALGQRRAQSVYQYLLGLGVSKGRLSTVTYGEEQPLVDASNESAWAQNRRVEFTLSEAPELVD